MKLPIYLDYQATTPVDPRVLEAMLPYFREEFGNAASRSHPFGWRAREAVERAREQVARLIGGASREIIFTSGATESNNLAIFGVAGMLEPKGGHVVTSAIEHHAVLDPCRQLERQGHEVTYLRPDPGGRIEQEQVREAIRDDTILVSIMAAHNEIGTLYPIADIGRITRERGVYFHSDAAQAIGKIPLSVRDAAVDLVSISAHKFYGPKGVGALYLRGRDPRVRLSPQILGGGHERGLRSGTLNVPAIVGLGCAAEIAAAELEEEATRVTRLRDRLQQGIVSGLRGVRLNGHPGQRLPGNLNLGFQWVQGESLLIGLQDLSVSSGSACTSSHPEPSYVLRALGVDKDLAHASIRFGIGRFTTEEEIDFAVKKVIETVKGLREISSVMR